MKELKRGKNSWYLLSDTESLSCQTPYPLRHNQQVTFVSKLIERVRASKATGYFPNLSSNERT